MPDRPVSVPDQSQTSSATVKGLGLPAGSPNAGNRPDVPPQGCLPWPSGVAFRLVKCIDIAAQLSVIHLNPGGVLGLKVDPQDGARIQLIDHFRVVNEPVVDVRLR